MMRKRKGYPVYPLTPAQKFHLFYLDFCPKKEVMNIGTSLTIGAELDWDILKQSIYKAYERCDSMRLRFAKDKEGTWYQYIIDKEERDIEFVDFSDKTMEEAEKIMTGWTSVPFQREDSPMNRVVMIHMPDGYNGMYLLLDHMTADAQSLICFMKDVIELYCSTMYEGVAYPKNMASYVEQLQKDLAYEAGSKAKERDEKFFRSLIDNAPEPIYNGIRGTQKLEEYRKMTGNPEARAAVNVSDSVDATLDIFHLEEEPTTRLMKFCEEYHVSLACLLLMGLRTYFQKMNGHEDVSINTAIARRATLREKKSGGTRIHSFPFRTIMSEDKTFLEGIYEIRDLQNEYFRHANYDPVQYFAYRSQKYPHRGATYEPIALTYQPMTLKEKGLEDLGDIKYKTKWYPNGATTQAAYLTVMHRPEDNGLDFNFEHQIKAVSREDLEFLYYYLCKIMFKGVENPNLSIGEIIRLI